MEKSRPDMSATSKIKRVSASFVRKTPNSRLECKIADTVEAARLYKIGYCQNGSELRADYYEYVYDNSFARRRRRNK